MFENLVTATAVANAVAKDVLYFNAHDAAKAAVAASFSDNPNSMFSARAKVFFMLARAHSTVKTGFTEKSCSLILQHFKSNELA